MPRTQKPFDQCYTVNENGCWLWQRNTTPGGYGLRFHEGKYRTAHRLSWTIHRGDIPAGMNVLHKCDVTLCINPDHLFLGTQKENVADAVSKGRGSQFVQRTHCRIGHPMTPDNVYLRPDNGYAYCRECMRVKKRRKATPDSSWVSGLLGLA